MVTTDEGSNLLANRYRLERVIGRGGMARVWAAHDEVLERPVAVKVLSEQFSDDDNFQARFRREAQQAASLNHPNIVKVYDTGSHDGLPFIVMELVEGRPLQQILRDASRGRGSHPGGLTEERAMEVAAEVCAALTYAHERGLIHRDVKPGNILIADDGSVKVTDFGIARAIDSQTVTQTAAVLGTAAYLSPEQARGAALDARSDLYSLGVVCYELLVGDQPFHADSSVSLAYQHVQEDPTPVRQRNPDVSAAAEAITMQALAKNPANRYRNAAAMRDDLLRARAGQPVRAPAVIAPDETAMLGGEVLSSRPRPPQTETQQRRRRGTGYLVLVVLTVLAFAGGILLVRSLFTEETAPQRTVPDVTNQTFDEARRSLEARGLEAEFRGSVYSSEIADDRVVRQEPDGGARVDDGSVVELTMSRGPRPVVVPDVAGMPEAEAIAELRNAGLSVGARSTQFSDEIAEGLVIATDPPIGESLTPNATVSLIVSAGEQTAIVPSVVGLHESDAVFRLDGSGFEPLVVHEFSETVDAGRVISQDPAGNTRARVGAEVAIVVSEGADEPEPEPTPTPSPPATTQPTTEPTASPNSEPSPTSSP